MPKFSIITPITYDKDNKDELRMPRYQMFLRCANSLITQTYKDFEWIVVDDECNPPVEQVLADNVSSAIDYKVVRLPEKGGRLIARNKGMEASTSDWLCWLDGDDEYASTYLEMVSNAISNWPDYAIFNFNHLIFSYDWHCYVREFIDMEKQGLEPFKSGTIGAGAFVFNRKVWEAIGPLPEKGVWDLAAWAMEAYPEMKPFYWNESKQGYDSLGNPWGEDWLYFYMMTRKYQCKKIDAAPYYVHSRWGHKLPGSPNFVADPGKDPEWSAKNQ